MTLRQKLHFAFIAAPLGLLLAGCAQGTRENAAGAASEPDTGVILEAAKARMEALGVGDIEGYLAAYQDDAVWMPATSEEIVGKPAARQRLQWSLADTTVEAGLKPDEFLVMSPDWVLLRGTYVVLTTPKSGGDTVEGVGSYVTLWHRQEDRSWKIAYDIWTEERQEQIPAK